MISIMELMQTYLGTEYNDERRVLSGGDLLTCERQQGSQRHMMCGDTPRERLQLLEPVNKDWHCLVTILEVIFITVYLHTLYMYILQVIWKILYKNSARSHGTLMFFRNKLNRTSLSKDVKKRVNATVDIINTVVKGHWLACACEILGISDCKGIIKLPVGIHKANAVEQRNFVESIAKKVVDQLTLISSAFLNPGKTADSKDTCYNYARLLCHYGSLVMEFRDAWAEGDGERILRCWKLFLPHFKANGRTKYSLAAFNLHVQTHALLSPNGAHQVTWQRFINANGGIGKNIPCDLFNEHVNKQVKHIIQNMGPNLIDTALHRAARSVSSLESICAFYDAHTGVPHSTSAHTTKSDVDDVKTVVKVVLNHNLLKPSPGRKHKAFPELHLDPLHNWDFEKTEKWIEKKKREVELLSGRGYCSESDEELEEDQDSSESD